MKEEGDVFKKFRDSFSRMEGHFHILEQRVPVELQMEYFKYSENVRKENRPPRPLSEDECETLYNTLLTEETTDKTEKRYLLSQLATSKSVRAYRLLEEYTQHPDPEVTDWAYMALMGVSYLFRVRFLRRETNLYLDRLGRKRGEAAFLCLDDV